MSKEITYNVFHLRTGQRHVVESTGPRAAIIEVAKNIDLTVKKRVNEKFIVNGLLYTIDRWNSDWQDKFGVKISEKRNSEEVDEFFNQLVKKQNLLTVASEKIDEAIRALEYINFDFNYLMANRYEMGPAIDSVMIRLVEAKEVLE